MDRSELEDEIGRLLGDKDHTRWTTDVIDTRLELAQTDVQALANAVKTTETLTPTANTAEVTIDDDTLDITRATLTLSTGEIFPLEGRSQDDLDFYVPNWQNLTPGKPETYFLDASNSRVILVPAPSSQYAIASALKLWEVRIPAPMTGDTSIPFDGNLLMRAYQMSLVNWVVAQCLMDNGDPESLARSKFFKTNNEQAPGEFEKEIFKIRRKFDSPSDIPARVLGPFPQGGRRGFASRLSKSNPIG